MYLLSERRKSKRVKRGALSLSQLTFGGGGGLNPNKNRVADAVWDLEAGSALKVKIQEI
jgi:hypothetical protein